MVPPLVLQGLVVLVVQVQVLELVLVPEIALAGLRTGWVPAARHGMMQWRAQQRGLGRGTVLTCSRHSLTWILLFIRGRLCTAAFPSRDPR